jgi:Ca-activated chloride channel family protein
MKRALLLFMFIPVITWADGIIIPRPWVDLAIERHIVEVSIQDQAATTNIDQSFLNLSEFGQVEGTYVFPLPEGAAISAFSMFVDGQALSAELLPADEARKIYEDIVRQQIDPALLEYAGRGAYRARIFPIIAGQPKRVQLSYSEIIPERSAIRKYIYPLNTEKFSARPLTVVSVSVDITTTSPIKNVYSPSHDIQVEKIDDHHVKVVYADENTTPNTDFVLYYSVSQDDVGVNLMTYRTPDDLGFYMLLVAPKIDVPQTDVAPKRMAVVLDRSGSMLGEKMTQAREALKFVLRNLNPQDQFNIFDYSTLVSSYANQMVAVNPDVLSAALAYADRLQASGGTNIHQALLTALGQFPASADGYVNMILFLTDGLATIGTTHNETILKDVNAKNASSVRIFTFGVGYEVNTHLLDLLGTQNSGTSTYVKPNEDIETEVSAFYEQVSNPILSNLALDFGNISTSDVYPSDLPDLFKGTQLVQLGRYSIPGNTPVVLSGTANGKPLSFSQQVLFPAQAEDHNFLPRLWATRKIGYLLDQIRLNGEAQELVDEIVSLSRTYGIITPYTSFLIVEDTPPPVLFDGGFKANSGQDAVAASESARNLAGAGAAPQTPGMVEGQKGGVKVVGTKTFYLRDGIWKDASYANAPTVDYVFGSPQYFDLVARLPELGPYLSVGKSVIVQQNDTAYRVLPETTGTGQINSDFNSDGKTDFADFLRFVTGYGKTAQDAEFESAFDLDNNGEVAFEDFLIFAASFGK